MYQNENKTYCPKNFSHLSPYFTNYEGELKQLIIELDSLIERKKLKWINENHEMEEKLNKAEASRQSMKIELEKKEFELISMTKTVNNLRNSKKKSLPLYEKQIEDLQMKANNMSIHFKNLEKKYKKKVSKDDISEPDILDIKYCQTNDAITSTETQEVCNYKSIENQRILLEQRCTKLESELFAKTIEISDRQKQINALEIVFKRRVNEIETKLTDMTNLKLAKEEELLSLKFANVERPITKNFRSQYSSVRNSLRRNMRHSCIQTDTSSRTIESMTNVTGDNLSQMDSTIIKLKSDLAEKSQHIIGLEETCISAVEAIKRLEERNQHYKTVYLGKLSALSVNICSETMSNPTDSRSAVCQTEALKLRSQANNTTIIETNYAECQTSFEAENEEMSPVIHKDMQQNPTGEKISSFPGFLTEALMALDNEYPSPSRQPSSSDHHLGYPSLQSTTSDQHTDYLSMQQLQQLHSTQVIQRNSSSQLTSSTVNSDVKDVVGSYSKPISVISSSISHPIPKQQIEEKEDSIKNPESNKTASVINLTMSPRSDTMNIGAFMKDWKSNEEEWLKPLTEETDNSTWLSIVTPRTVEAKRTVSQNDIINKRPEDQLQLPNSTSVIISPCCTTRRSTTGEESMLEASPSTGGPNELPATASTLAAVPLSSTRLDVGPATPQCIFQSETPGCSLSSSSLTDASIIPNTDRAVFSHSPSPWLPSPLEAMQQKRCIVDEREDMDLSLENVSEYANFNLTISSLLGKPFADADCTTDNPLICCKASHPYATTHNVSAAGDSWDVYNGCSVQNEIHTTPFSNKVPSEKSFVSSQMPLQTIDNSNHDLKPSGEEEEEEEETPCSESSDDGDWDPHRTVADFLVSERTQSARLEEMIDWQLQSIRMEHGLELTARHDLPSQQQPLSPQGAPSWYGRQLENEEQRRDYATIFIGDS